MGGPTRPARQQFRSYPPPHRRENKSPHSECATTCPLSDFDRTNGKRVKTRTRNSRQTEFEYPYPGPREQRNTQDSSLPQFNWNSEPNGSRVGPTGMKADWIQIWDGIMHLELDVCITPGDNALIEIAAICTRGDEKFIGGIGSFFTIA